MPLKKTHGVALITAMLVTALVSLIALDLAARQQLDIRRTGNILNYDQALLYNQGMEDWAIQILFRDAAQGETDHLGEEWAISLPILPIEGGELAGELIDQQGLYNLNNLAQGAINEIERFKKLLQVLELSPDLAEAVVDWLDADQERIFPGGAEDQEYLLLRPPYRAANHTIHSISELRLVKGFSAPVYQRIAPFITALPEPTPININTAPLPIILALAPDLRIEQAQEIIEKRGFVGYKDTQSFMNQPTLVGQTNNLNSGTGISVKSNWFLAYGRATIGQLSVESYSLLFRNKGRIAVIRHNN